MAGIVLVFGFVWNLGFLSFFGIVFMLIFIGALLGTDLERKHFEILIELKGLRRKG